MYVKLIPPSNIDPTAEVISSLLGEECIDDDSDSGIICLFKEVCILLNFQMVSINFRDFPTSFLIRFQRFVTLKLMHMWYVILRKGCP